MNIILLLFTKSSSKTFQYTNIYNIIIFDI